MREAPRTWGPLALALFNLLAIIATIALTVVAAARDEWAQATFWLLVTALSSLTRRP